MTLADVNDTQFFLLGKNRQHVIGDRVWKRRKYLPATNQYQIWPYTYREGGWYVTQDNRLLIAADRPVTIIE